MNNSRCIVVSARPGSRKTTLAKKLGEMLPPDEYVPPRFDCPTVEVSTEKGYELSLDQIIKSLKINVSQVNAIRD